MFIDKKEELEALGYTVSKSGKNILKEGRAIAGVTPEGNIWSGSREVTATLKGTKEKPKSKPKSSAPKTAKKKPLVTKRKASPSQSEPKTVSSAAVPEVETNLLDPVSGGRGDGLIDMATRAIDRVPSTPSKGTKPLVVRGVLAGTHYKGAGKYTKEEWQEMSRSERKKAGLPLSVAGGALFKGFK